MNSGIYKISNKINGKFYVGQTSNLDRRRKEHLCLLGRRGNTVLGRALKKYGRSNFDFDVIESCPREDLDRLEQFYIGILCPDYNVSTGGPGNGGHIVTPEVRRVLAIKARVQWDNLSQDRKDYIRTHCLIGQRFKIGHPVSKTMREKLRTSGLEYFRTHKTSDLQRKRASEVNKICQIGNCCRQRPVCQIDLCTNSVIAIFPMAKTASEVTGASRSGITHTCKRRQRHCGGFGWKYADPKSVETIPKGSRAISSLEAQSHQTSGE